MYVFPLELYEEKGILSKTPCYNNNYLAFVYQKITFIRLG